MRYSLAAEMCVCVGPGCCKRQLGRGGNVWAIAGRAARDSPAAEQCACDVFTVMERRKERKCKSLSRARAREQGAPRCQSRVTAEAVPLESYDNGIAVGSAQHGGGGARFMLVFDSFDPPTEGS